MTTGRAAGHGLQRRQAEAFVARGKDEAGGRFVEAAQGFERDEAEEAHDVLHAALDHGLAHGGILRDGVADDDQAEVLVDGMRGELFAHHGEGLHQARNVLVPADIAGVEQERVVDLIAFEDELLFLRRRARRRG